MTLLELREQRAKLVADTRAILEKAEKETRSLTGEEQEQWDKLIVDVEKLGIQIATQERQERTTALEVELRTPAGRQTPAGQPTATIPLDSRTRANALRAWFMYGSEARVAPHMLAAADQCGVNLASKSINIRLGGPGGEERSSSGQSKGSGGAGDYLVPDDFSKEMDIALKAYGPMLSAARVMPSGDGRDWLVPTVNTTAQLGRILGENSPASVLDVAFGQTLLKTFKYTSDIILTSLELLQDSAFPLEDLLVDVIAQRIGRKVNLDTTVGGGTTEPNGFITDATQGVTGDITFDKMIDLMNSVDVAYHPGAAFMCHQQNLGEIMKLRDGQDRPIYLPSLVAGAPSTFLGFPIQTNNDMADGTSVTAGDKVLAFGQFKKYWIRQARDIQLTRFNEKYMDQGSIAWVAFQRYGGRLIDAGTHPIKYLENA